MSTCFHIGLKRVCGNEVIKLDLTSHKDVTFENVLFLGPIIFRVRTILPIV